MPAVNVLHEDDRIVVVDKPPGTLVVPVPGRGGETLVDLVASQLGRRVQAVHRLDEETSGCIAFALDDEARAALDRMFRQHTIQRDYLALVTAVPNPTSGCIESRLQEGTDGVVRVVARGGKRAVTHYSVVERRGRSCLVRCRLETGRRNQIRAHMSALGCPVAGDRKYGYRARKTDRFPRVMLHSWRMELEHPFGGGVISVACEAAESELRP